MFRGTFFFWERRGEEPIFGEEEEGGGNLFWEGGNFLLVFVPDHPHCHSTALVFSLYTRRDIDSDDSYARPLVHACAQPIVWFERERKLRAGHRAENTANIWRRKNLFFRGFAGSTAA